MEEEPTREHYVGSDITNPLCLTKTTNGDYDETAGTPKAATASIAPRADENDDDRDDKHEYVITETDNNIESKKNQSYYIDKQCLKQIVDATNEGTKSIPNTRFKKY